MVLFCTYTHLHVHTGRGEHLRHHWVDQFFWSTKNNTFKKIISPHFFLAGRAQFMISGNKIRSEDWFYSIQDDYKPSKTKIFSRSSVVRDPLRAFKFFEKSCFGGTRPLCLSTYEHILYVVSIEKSLNCGGFYVVYFFNRSFVVIHIGNQRLFPSYSIEEIYTHVILMHMEYMLKS